MGGRRLFIGLGIGLALAAPLSARAAGRAASPAQTLRAEVQYLEAGNYSGFYGVDPQLVTLGLVDAASGKVDNGAISKTATLRFADFTEFGIQHLATVLQLVTAHLSQSGR